MLIAMPVKDISIFRDGEQANALVATYPHFQLHKLVSGMWTTRLARCFTKDLAGRLSFVQSPLRTSGSNCGDCLWVRARFIPARNAANCVWPVDKLSRCLITSSIFAPPVFWAMIGLKRILHLWEARQGYFAGKHALVSRCEKGLPAVIHGQSVTTLLVSCGQAAQHLEPQGNYRTAKKKGNCQGLSTWLGHKAVRSLWISTASVCPAWPLCLLPVI